MGSLNQSVCQGSAKGLTIFGKIEGFELASVETPISRSAKTAVALPRNLTIFGKIEVFDSPALKPRSVALPRLQSLCQGILPYLVKLRFLTRQR